MSNFILDRVKEHFGDDEDSEGGFDDMNYLIGNSSAMSMGEVPTPMDERIGYAAQVGGSIMELQITNPATFTLERDSMISTIHQLGLDITTHPDMNAGFCTAEKSARGEEYGYETVEQYFTNYLQELAQFKKHVERQGPEDKPLFEIGRMNPHISTSPMPSLEERMANDVGLDPFGYQVDEYNEEMRKMRKAKGHDIWANKEFLKKFYNLYLVDLVDQKWQLFTGRQGLFTQYSDKFDRVYRDTMRQACDEFYDTETSTAEKPVQARVSLISTAARADVGVQNAWLNKIDTEVEPINTLSINDAALGDALQDIPQNIKDNLPDNIKQEFQPVIDNFTISKLSDLNNYLEPNVRVTRINSLAEALYKIDNQEFQMPNRELRQAIQRRSTTLGLSEQEANILTQILIQVIEPRNLDKIEKWAKDEIKEGLDDIWHGNTNEGEEDKFLITVQGKLQALANNADIEVDRIRNEALGKKGEGPDGNKYGIDEAAEYTLANEEGFFDEDERYYQFMDALIGQFGREMWKESNLFYYIIPGWMSEADTNYEGHDGWKAPKFIWDSIVESKWADRDDVNLDLTEPRNGVYDEDKDSDVFHFLDLLEESDEFQRDVAAAVGACYCWAHFTQRKAKFDLKGRDFGLTGEEQREVQNDGWTWVEWMNRFGLGVNLETMAGSPQMRFKVWRPKDIAVTAHAINLTTRRMFQENGELGGLDHLNDEIDGRPAKFTIDMEHVATLGAPPLDEMERFIEKEGELAESDWDLGIDPDKPIANILRQMHLMDPGVEDNRGTHHGAFERGNMLLYEWLYKFVENGFTRNENEAGTVLFELAEHKGESTYMMKITMNLIELGVDPEELDPSNVTPGEEPEDEREAMIARFFGMEQVNYNREWAKIEEHAFDPLQGLLEAEQFDYTYSSAAAIQNDTSPRDWPGEEYQ